MKKAIKIFIFIGIILNIAFFIFLCYNYANEYKPHGYAGVLCIGLAKLICCGVFSTITLDMLKDAKKPNDLGYWRIFTFLFVDVVAAGIMFVHGDEYFK